MGDADKQSGKKYRERDERIMLGLRSSDSAKREEAMDLLKEGLRWPLALLLRKIAMKSTTAVFELILDDNLRVDDAKYEPIWQETIKCLCENIKKDDFVFKGNLFAYLNTIARRLTEKRWRSERRLHQSDTLDEIAVKSSDDLEEAEELEKLLKKIDQFYDTLNENNKIVLRIGMRLMTSDDSKPRSMKVLVQKIQSSKAWEGNDETILRRYGRLREKLRKFLKDQGYDD